MNSRRRLLWSLTGTYLAIFTGLAGLVLLLTTIAFAPSALLLFFCFGALGLSAALSALGTAWLFAGRISQEIHQFDDALQGAVRAEFAEPAPAVAGEQFDEFAMTVNQTLQYFQESSTRQQNDLNRLRTVINSMVEGVIAVDGSQRIMLVNAAACGLFKLREQSAIGRPLWELVRNPRLQFWVTRAFEQTEPVGGDMELLGPASPRILMVSVAQFPIQPQQGAVVVVADVTELRRLERIRQEFIANASHELKTPLASIKACVETLLDGASTDPRFLEKFLGTINDQTDRLDLLVQDMLTLARVESETLVREAHPVVVSQVLQTCLDRYQQAAERKQLQIIADEVDGSVQVLADEEALEQIFDNLIDNAIKYTNEGGRVTVRCRAEDSQGRIEVDDTGIGIPQNQLPRIFERFYRVDRHRSRDIGGTGLGLSIVKHLVQAVGGSVAVSSRLNQGSTFTVRLPLSLK